MKELTCFYPSIEPIFQIIISGSWIDAWFYSDFSAVYD